MPDKLYQYGEYRQPYQSELDYFKNNTNVGGMATEDNKIILNPYSNLSNEQKRQVALNEGVRLFLRKNPNYIGNFGLTKQGNTWASSIQLMRLQSMPKDCIMNKTDITIEIELISLKGC